jgi:peroxiredoxin
MRRHLAIALTAVLFASQVAYAALPDGAKAPLFTATATLGGRTYPFSLAKALHKGPVVLYFYLAAFTPGCTVEAHLFAKAMPKFKALGATVIGVSHDSIAKLKRFSVSACRKKFPVAADTSGRIMKAYDAVLPSNPMLANRVSYVITPGDRVYYSYTNLDPRRHVANTLAAVRRWDRAHPRLVKH